MRTDWLIVGAGFTGCTLAERIASQLGRRVLLIDQRPHIGGNAYDCHNQHSILIHKYGPHIFHTNSAKVWDYLSQFTQWRPYEHQVLAVVDGRKAPVPFNLNSLHLLFPAPHASRLETLLVEQYGAGAKVPILQMRQSAAGELAELADFVYRKFFYGYTLKQWELKPEELDPSVTARVPVHISRDNRYFQDKFQAMPQPGYTELFRRMLAHPKIEVLLDTSFLQLAGAVSFERMIFTGPIDEFFDYRHGELPYRSLRFESDTRDQAWFQEVGTVNYPNEQAYTRITEQKHLTGQEAPKTTLILEYPEAYRRGRNEPYYPIPRPENRERYQLYLEEARKLQGRVLFAGRLADYKYYNMDQVVARALMLFEEEVARP